MPQIHAKSRPVPHQRVRALCQGLLDAAGLTRRDARQVADVLMHATLRGVDSHGVARLPHYLSRIEHGSIKPRPRIGTTRLAPALAVVDGDDGLGHLVMRQAADEAIALARDAGAGWVTLQNSSHCGALSYFGLRIAEAGMIGLVFTHVDPMVLPHGAAEPFCGTNPICLTAPGEDGEALCLDMATSVTPWNTVANAEMEGVAIPRGWAVDADGRDVCDPEQVAALYPVGGHKGSGLGLMIDVLCALLGGAPCGPDIPAMYGDLAQPRKLGGMVGAINLQPATDPDQARRRISSLIRRWGAVRPQPGVDRVLYPGEPEVIEQRRRMREGIPMGVRLMEQLESLAEDYGLASRPVPVQVGRRPEPVALA